MVVINNIRGLKIRWDQGRSAWEKQERLFLLRLAHARRVAYLNSKIGRGYDGIGLAKSRKYEPMVISMVVLARLLGFSPAVTLPKPPTRKQCQEDWERMDWLTRPDFRAYYRWRRDEVVEERLRLLRSISDGAHIGFLSWLRSHYEVYSKIID